MGDAVRLWASPLGVWSAAIGGLPEGTQERDGVGPALGVPTPYPVQDSGKRGRPMLSAHDGCGKATRRRTGTGPISEGRCATRAAGRYRDGPEMTFSSSDRK